MLNIYCSNIEPIGKSSNYPAGNHFARLIAQNTTEVRLSSLLSY